MKTFRASFALLLLAGVLVRAQDPVPVVTAPAAETTNVVRTPEQLEQLLAPIALYPDALLAIILPAATAPTDIVLAARQVREFPDDRSQIEHRAWDESVKSLTHYAEVLQWLDENLDWTKQVGEAFAAQPAEVMQTIQRLRAKARAAGTLVDTAQQQVIAEPDVIRIVPAQPDVIYVPYYQPEVVFVGRPSYYSPSFFSFGIGYPVGSWLAFDCDWRRNTIWVGNRHRPWTGHDWRRPLISPVSAGSAYVRGPGVRQWRPPPAAPRRVITNFRPAYAEVPRPAPIGGAFGRPSGPQRNFSGATHRPQSQGIANPSAFTPSYAPTARGQSPGLRSLPANTAPALASPPAVAPTVPSPHVAPPPNATPKSSHINRAPDSTSRGRGYRSSSPSPATPPAANTFTAPPASPSSNTVTSHRPSSRPSRAIPAPPAASSYTARSMPPPSTTVTPQRHSSRPTYTTPSPNNTYTAPRATPPSNAVSPQRPSSRPTPPAQSSTRGPTATPPAATTPAAAAPSSTTSTTTPPPPRSNNGNGRFRDRHNNGG